MPPKGQRRPCQGRRANRAGKLGKVRHVSGAVLQREGWLVQPGVALPRLGEADAHDCHTAAR
jgi:hypothetical protein